ncbi:MAG: hypothetical protein R3C03_22130 [Pirellulaceae bacterium]
MKIQRAAYLGKKRFTRSLFSWQGIFHDFGYAIHDGGRSELQYNIGVDDNGELRFGVAFSFETSRTVPDVSILGAKARRLNLFVGEYPDFFDGLDIWAWANDEKVVLSKN